MSDINSQSSRSYADLHKRFIGEADVFHSNVYAQEAHGPRIGSTSAETFTARLGTHTNRQTVRSYRESSIGASYGVSSSRPTESVRGQVNSAARPTSSMSSPTPPQRTFREPPSRQYNPYG